MKNTLLAALCLSAMSLSAQIETPQPSPSASFKQTVGLTEIEVEYSRPAKRDRVIFGDLVPYNEVWRTGANKNTIFSTSDVLIFGKDTLKPGSYALYSKPMEANSWEVIFYKNTENWGTPSKWNDEMVALSVKSSNVNLSDVTESFTISVDAVKSGSAILSLTWDKTKAMIPFTVPTKERVFASIDKVMNGPTANDYYAAADFYLSEKKDLDQALVWINKALDMRKDTPFWILRKKSLIQAELGDYKGAIETAKVSMEAARKAEYMNYVKFNEESIKEWSAKLK